MLYISARNIIFNPKTAWASPKAIPEWVQKRCTAKDVYWISRLIILKTSWNSSYSATTISSWLRLVGIWLSNRYCIYACSVSCILFQKVQIQSFIQRVKIHWRDEMAVLNMSQVDDVIGGQYRLVYLWSYDDVLLEDILNFCHTWSGQSSLQLSINGHLCLKLSWKHISGQRGTLIFHDSWTMSHTMGP